MVSGDVRTPPEDVVAVYGEGGVVFGVSISVKSLLAGLYKQL